MIDTSRNTLAEIQAMLEGYADPAILIGEDYRIHAANQAYVALYKHPSPLLEKHCHEISHNSPVPCHQNGESCPLLDSLGTGQTRRVLHIHHTPRGDEYVDVETRPVGEDSNGARYFLEILRPAASAHPSPAGLVGRSPSFTRMLELVQRVAPSDTSVLLIGESGTGKELVAQALHAQSNRRNHLFVPVECSGLTESLFESELFGHEKGAFTGAHIRKIGLVEAARGGTLLLDEVGDIPPQLQVKLLRLLETGSFRRVGSTDPQQADFRLVCATHRNLRQMVAQGTFRQDLFFRIGVFPIQLPPLRERREDIALLSRALLQRLAPHRALRLSAKALACLEAYDFPGNVRELRNVLERGSLMTDGSVIDDQHIWEVCTTGRSDATGPEPAVGEILSLVEMERRYLTQVVRHYRGDRKSLARMLGVSERTLFRKLKSLHIAPESEAGP
jgi:DNA-binding NtrC family response regulator